MKKIYLICAAGLSTSMMVEKMKKAASKDGFECMIQAVGIPMAESIMPNADCILLGPQIRFEKENICKIAGDVPVAVIDMKDYGRMNGEAVIQQAKKLMEDR
ncbi:PTS sugar transporter subunit IIB [Clostridium sp. AF19-22AC]|jgi:PTS system cellobiose-specific IIB component|uniref:PTS sugar transporter subunit IIB n=1 Tax=Clostridia TaxID=186801 RepID=UPI000E4D5A4E|nr:MULTISPECIES: PTS sugar transporter subunit IIB [Clostridia]RHR20624.1 PTS sugar transporter subunit IIB [Clostridium sp. AF19-22AC]